MVIPKGRARTSAGFPAGAQGAGFSGETGELVVLAQPAGITSDSADITKV
jgi:hypothetical protein